MWLKLTGNNNFNLIRNQIWNGLSGRAKNTIFYDFRYLVKNLIVGYFTTPADKRTEVLRVIATVLDFNREDRQKTGLEATSMWPFGRGNAGGETGDLARQQVICELIK